MKRFISLAAFILLVSLPVVSQKMTIFGGVPFNGNLEQFVTKMVEKGFEYIDDEGHDAFVGKYLGDDVEVFMMGNTNTGQLIGVTAIILNKEFNEQTAVKKVREIAGKLGQMYKIQKWTIKDLGGNYKATIQSGGKNVIIGIKRDFNLDLGKYLVSTTFMTNIK